MPTITREYRGRSQEKDQAVLLTYTAEDGVITTDRLLELPCR
jgi:hypothetical protein